MPVVSYQFTAAKRLRCVEAPKTGGFVEDSAWFERQISIGQKISV
jgi:hypothetical protein